MCRITHYAIIRTDVRFRPSHGRSQSLCMNSESNLKQLIDVYCSAQPDSMALFLGAGVNLPVEEQAWRYPTYTWTELLRALYEHHAQRFDQPFADLLAQHGGNWPALAETLVGVIGAAELAATMDAVLYNDIPRGDQYGRLSKRLLRQAPSLHAAICFSAQIRSRTHSSWTFGRNPRVGMIMTTNYDFFFGAGWTRYQAFKEHWKVQTPFSTSQINNNQRLIVYLHGYLPYTPGQKRPIVLRQTEYDSFYAPGGFADQMLARAISQYHLIFVGLSFTDPPLRELLLNTRDRPQHFAIAKENLAGDVERLGVTPVVVEHYADVARVLREVYISVLNSDTCRSVEINEPIDYWQRLKIGPRIRS